VSAAVDSSSQTPPLVEEEAPFKNTQVVLERTEIWPCVSTGPEIKKDCAGEGHQQFTAIGIASGDGFVSVIEEFVCSVFL
jgi:hypothetical protein